MNHLHINHKRDENDVKTITLNAQNDQKVKTPSHLAAFVSTAIRYLKMSEIVKKLCSHVVDWQCQSLRQTIQTMTNGIEKPYAFVTGYASVQWQGARRTDNGEHRWRWCFLETAEGRKRKITSPSMLSAMKTITMKPPGRPRHVLLGRIMDKESR